MSGTWRIVALSWLVTALAASGEAMLQYFNTSWGEMRDKIPELAEAGYESLWIPPPTKAGGGYSVGYDLFDRFDLGSKDQRGTIGTRYGTEQDLLDLIRVAHRFGIRVYFDSIMNHNGFDVPAFNEFVPEDFYPGFLPDDFHLRDRGDGTYRKWDNTRDWGSEWQVQNLGLSGLIDIANEPGTTNRNHGGSEGDTSTKISFLRHPDHPEYYCYVPTTTGQRHADNDGTYVGFGPGNGITSASLAANASFYSEYVEEMLHRSLRWQLDRTRADGARLDAVKHTPADFFGATFGGDKDISDYGYLGQGQRQFNLSRGFSDANHRDTVFDIGAGRDDAMFFGEHLGQPPAYGPYIDAGMRLIDNDLRNNFNNILGNPSATLSGYDAPGAGGFAPGVSVMHAQSHDNDFASRRELQHAFYFTRDGLPLVYTDGNHHAGDLEGSGGAFPRHANTAYLGQWGDNRLPNLAYIHQHFSRGFQKARWADNDFVAYERIDKREGGGMSDADGAVAIVMVNDNYSSGAQRNLSTSFPSTPFIDDAYLFQYARGYGSQVGFYKYASQLDEVNVNPGSYFVFSYRTPEESNAWKKIGGRPIEIFQNGLPASTVTVTRRDGSNGDGGFNGPGANPGFHPYPSDITNPGSSDYRYEIELPRVTDVSNMKFVFRADRSAANILCKLDGGIDLNGTAPNSDPATRDNPPALSTDVFLGYEQPNFLERMGPEKFAATDTSRCTLGAKDAERWSTIIGSGSVTRLDGLGSNPHPPDTVDFVYHDPGATLPGTIAAGTHYQENPGAIEIYAKTNSGLGGYKGALYYTLDGSVPEGAGGVGVSSSTLSVPMTWAGDAEGGSWWKGSISPVPSGTLRYVAGLRRATVNPIFPSGASEVADKVDGMTVFEIDGFDGSAVQYFPHNDYERTPDQSSFVMATGLDEGFHIIRARAFLPRDGKASLYNTFQQTFYYDASRPQGEVVFPLEAATVDGQSYGAVVRADASVKEVWFYIDDGAGVNDDDQTGAGNGNGVGKWVQASEAGPDPTITSSYPKEFRFNYANIPSGNLPAVLQVRLVEATSADQDTWTGTVGPADDLSNWYTTLTRNVIANGPDQQLFVSFPAQNGDTVDDNYTLKAYFTKSIGDGFTEQELIDEFSVRIASQQSGSPDGAVEQDKALYSIAFNETADYHALAFDVPNLYNGDPDFLHYVEIVHERDGITLAATRLVMAAVETLPFASIVTPPIVDGAGQPYLEVLPDVFNPSSADREIPIRVETDSDAAQVDIVFLIGSGTVNLAEVEAAGSQQYWDFIWSNAAPGVYRIRADVRKALGGPVVRSILRNVTVVLGPTVPEDQDDDGDTLPDWWEIAKGLDPTDNGTTNFDNGPNGDPDDDGIDNWTEFLVGLNPLLADAADYPHMLVSENPDGSVTLEFDRIPDRFYKLFWSGNLQSWSPFGPTIGSVTLLFPDTYQFIDDGPPTTPTHPGAEQRRFYRVSIGLSP